MCMTCHACGHAVAYMVHVMVLCVWAYSHYMHDLSCWKACGCIHGVWIHVPPIIGALVLGHTQARDPSCMHVDRYSRVCT